MKDTVKKQWSKFKEKPIILKAVIAFMVATFVVLGALMAFLISALYLGGFKNDSPTVFWALVALLAAFLSAYIGFSCWLYVRYFDIPLTRLNEFILSIMEDKKSDELSKVEQYLPLTKELGIMQQSVSTLFSRRYNSKLLLKQAELDALQSQINPHFLYNTLETMRGLALAKGEKDLAKMTKALAMFFRYSISRADNMVSVKDELQNVGNYFIILQYRFDDRFALEVDFGEDEKTISEYQIPKFCLQPIVENSVKHGLERKMGKGKITIKGYITKTSAVLCVEDDGIGMEYDKLLEIKERLSQEKYAISRTAQTHSMGIALSNVNDRLYLCYSENFGLNIYSTLGVGTKVELRLPLLQQGDKGDCAGEIK